jgi:ubiquinone/menaquinone biosynthesis C-methylase UbiE
MLSRFKQRSYELEHLDTGSYTSEEYEGCIVELQRVNRWLGDARILRDTLLCEVAAQKLKVFSVLDVGAGSGELLRVAERWARETKRSFMGVGLELNERSAQAILEESNSAINAVRGDALNLPFVNGQFDYVFCSLFTHHFVEQQVVDIFREMSRVGRRGVFVIDLYRHPIAYFLYTTIGKLFLHNRLLREDGALSILRSFTVHELIELAERAEMKNASVTRHFPFRLVLTAMANGSPAYTEPLVRTNSAAQF